MQDLSWEGLGRVSTVQGLRSGRRRRLFLLERMQPLRRLGGEAVRSVPREGDYVGSVRRCLAGKAPPEIVALLRVSSECGASEHGNGSREVAAGHGSNPISSGRRLEGIYRRLRWPQGAGLGKSWWDAPLSRGGLLAGMTWGCLAMGLELRLWPEALYRLVKPPLPSGASIPVLLITAWFVNAILVERLLSRCTAARHRPRSWLVLLRWTFGGIPGLSLFAVSLWRRIEQTRPGWGFRDPPAAGSPRPMPFSSTASPADSAVRHLLGSWLNHLEGSFWMPLWFAANLVIMVLASVWLAGDWGTRPLRWLGVVAAHLFGYLSARAALLEPDRGAYPRKLRRSWLLLCWLSPSPIPLGWWLVGLSLDVGASGERTLCHAAFIRRQGRRSLGSWLGLQDSLREAWASTSWREGWRRPWGLDEPVEVTRSEKRFRAVLQAKLLLLLADSATLGWVLGLVCRRSGRAAYAVGIGIQALWYLAAAAAALGGGLLVITLARNLVAPWVARWSLPFAAFLAASFALFLLGLWSGVFLAYGQERSVTAALLLAGSVWGLLEGIRLIIEPHLSPRLGRKRHLSQAVRRPAVLVVLLAVSAAIMADEARAAVACEVLRVCLVLTPVWGLFLFRSRFGHLAHPFERRHLSTPDLPGVLRQRLRWLALGLALPLGGLAAPFWLRLRPQLVQSWKSLSQPPEDERRESPA